MAKSSLLRTFIIVFIILIIGGGVFYFFQSQNQKKVTYQTEKVVKGNVQEIVSISGSVIAASDINLNFRNPGKIKEIRVAVGNIVSSGETLATLDDFDAQNRVQQAQANLDLANSNLDKARAGVKNEDILLQNTNISNATRLVEINEIYVENIRKQVSEDLILAQLQVESNRSLAAEAQKNLESAQTLADKQINQGQTQITVARNSFDQARKVLEKTRALNDQSSKQAELQKNNADSYLLALREAREDIQREIRDGTATESQKIQYDLQITQAENSLDVAIKNLDLVRAENQNQEEQVQTQIITAQNQISQAEAALEVTRNQSQNQIDNQLSALEHAQNNLKVAEQNIQITKAQGDVRINTAQTQLINAQNQKATTEAQLQTLTATTRDVDLAPLEAQVAIAQAALDLAKNQVEDTSIKAPVNGVVTVVNRRNGEEAQGTTPVITLISEGKLQIEANVSETDIAKLRVGNKIQITFDALSPDQNFSGTLVSINPNSTVISGVTYYTVKAIFETALEDKDLIKPGMTANLDIITNTAENVLLVPLQTIKTNKDGKYVEVLIDNKPVERPVTLGIQGEQLIEVKSGISENEMVITFTQEE